MEHTSESEYESSDSNSSKSQRNSDSPSSSSENVSDRIGRIGRYGISTAIWATPGALLQSIGGSGKQLGILFSTGLLLANLLAGWRF